MDSFDLERVASQNYMGLTANYRGHPALIVGWDGKEGKYTLETENGRRFKTADFIWHYETLGDPEVAEVNARIAAWRSDESPFRELKVRLSYDAETGRWEGYEVTSGIRLSDLEADPIALDADPDFGGDDEARVKAEAEAEYEQALADAGYFVEEWSKLEGEIPDEILLDPIIMLLPDIIEAASDPKLDGLANPEIKKFFDTDGESCGCHKNSKRFKNAFLPFAAGPILGAAGNLARSLMPAMAIGRSVDGLKDIITPEFAGPTTTYNTALPAEYADDQLYYAHQVNVINEHFIQLAAADSDIVTSMRDQVVNALRAVSSETEKVWGDQGPAIWYSLMELAQSADSVAVLQSVLQSIPEEHRNANPGIGIPDPENEAPAPFDLPMVPGGEVPAEPSVAPVEGGEDVLGGGPLVQEQPVGTAPGGGIPGGPGRRSSKVSNDETRNQKYLDNQVINRAFSQFKNESPEVYYDIGNGIYKLVREWASSRERFGLTKEEYLELIDTAVLAFEEDGRFDKSRIFSLFDNEIGIEAQDLQAAIDAVPDVEDHDWLNDMGIRWASQQEFFAELGIKESVVTVSKVDTTVEDFLKDAQGPHNPLPGVAPTLQSTPPVQPTTQVDKARDKAEIDTAVQAILAQEPDLPYSDAVQRAALELDIARSRAEGTRPVIAGASFSPEQQAEFINEAGTARNLHKLRLEGTHYVDDDEDFSVEDSSIF